MTTNEPAPSPSTEARHVECATMRKVSIRLIPFLFVLYVAAYLDRINVGFAQLQMKEALGFSDSVYGLGTGIFFVGYFLFEVPSNLILARTGARVWIARIMLTWGLISSAMAIVRTPEAFYALRFLLGAAEAGFFPGIIYYMSRWFPAAERASAVSRFMTALAISGLIGGPLSGALFKLDGVASLAGWQWIFLAEGIPSIILGVAVLFFLTERPEEAKWLLREERECLAAKLRAEADDIAKRGHVSLRRALLHPTVWRLSLLSFTLLVGLYSISFWLPQIIKSFSGLDNVEVAILSAIPYMAATVAMVIAGAHSDRSRERCLHIAGAALIGAAGLAASAYVYSPVTGLIALSVATAGIFSAIPIFWSLPTAFLRGTAAAGAIALINSLGNLGGFVGPYLIGRVHDATGSFAISLLSIAALLLGGAGLALSLRRTPANADASLAVSAVSTA
jgi:ACS family tartrate transporter-like MFS transporter